MGKNLLGLDLDFPPNILPQSYNLNSPQCQRLAAPILRLVMFSVVSIVTSSLAQIGSSSKNLMTITKMNKN
jgi:hypothetical protein